MNFDKLATRYDELRGGTQRARQAADVLRPHLVPGDILEVGVGTGAIAAELRDRGRVYGVDVSGPMLEQARAHLAGHLLRASALALPLLPHSVANVVFSHVLHLVGDLPAAVAEAARVLRPGGRMLALHGEPFTDPDDVVHAMAPLDALKPPRPDSPEKLEAEAAAVGLRLTHQRPVVELERGVPPVAFVAIVTDRQAPFLWHVDDATWQRVVEPVLAALRALPDPDRPRHQAWHAMFSTFEAVPR